MSSKLIPIKDQAALVLDDGKIYKIQHKRQRKILSCVLCHQRKIKCSREHPSCANCIKNGLNCCYFVNDRVSNRPGETQRQQPNGNSFDVNEGSIQLNNNDLDSIRQNGHIMVSQKNKTTETDDNDVLFTNCHTKKDMKSKEKLLKAIAEAKKYQEDEKYLIEESKKRKRKYTKRSKKFFNNNRDGDMTPKVNNYTNDDNDKTHSSDVILGPTSASNSPTINNNMSTLPVPNNNNTHGINTSHNSINSKFPPTISQLQPSLFGNSGNTVAMFPSLLSNNNLSFVSNSNNNNNNNNDNNNDNDNLKNEINTTPLTNSTIFNTLPTSNDTDKNILTSSKFSNKIKKYLPSKERSYELLERYIIAVHPLLPLIDLTHYHKQHDNFWSINNSFHPTNFLLLLLAVNFASTKSLYHELHDQTLKFEMDRYKNGLELLLNSKIIKKTRRLLMTRLTAQVLVNSVSENPKITTIAELVRLSQKLMVDCNNMDKIQRILCWQIFQLDTLTSLHNNLLPLIKLDEFEMALPSEVKENGVLDPTICFLNAKYRFVLLLNDLCSKTKQGVFNGVKERIVDLHACCMGSALSLSNYKQQPNNAQLTREMNKFIDWAMYMLNTFADRACLLLHLNIIKVTMPVLTKRKRKLQEFGENFLAIQSILNDSGTLTLQPRQGNAANMYDYEDFTTNLVPASIHYLDEFLKCYNKMFMRDNNNYNDYSLYNWELIVSNMPINAITFALKTLALDLNNNVGCSGNNKNNKTLDYNLTHDLRFILLQKSIPVVDYLLGTAHVVCRNCFELVKLLFELIKVKFGKHDCDYECSVNSINNKIGERKNSDSLENNSDNTSNINNSSSDGSKRDIIPQPTLHHCNLNGMTNNSGINNGSRLSVNIKDIALKFETECGEAATTSNNYITNNTSNNNNNNNNNSAEMSIGKIMNSNDLFPLLDANLITKMHTIDTSNNADCGGNGLCTTVNNNHNEGTISCAQIAPGMLKTMLRNNDSDINNNKSAGDNSSNYNYYYGNENNSNTGEIIQEQVEETQYNKLAKLQRIKIKVQAHIMQLNEDDEDYDDDDDDDDDDSDDDDSDDYGSQNDGDESHHVKSSCNDGSNMVEYDEDYYREFENALLEILCGLLKMT
ncbi:uncharacterized protein SCDLUD_001397 [Saccharomycodes ludwigii]|uniref:uncharacterized protein n=1 Tax=Saccharomycodes ludwigii TaxID=36035 RepID=UPI001E8C7D8B|nr:hypothetical protein SCDLUD_001397 [Saccharomycodes ludwigii]KAH3901631.1 hypothetical protein SCDLUD_001397 [Saccharomycodes ludwigii]